jgi:hypothetical protein
MANASTVDRGLFHRLIPSACVIVLLAGVLLICFKIVSFGYVPGGDARRHTARAFTDKPFRDIVVMKPFYVVDQSIGWETLLRVIQRATGCSIDALMSFSVFFLLAVLLAVPMVFLRRPEAWLAAVLAELVAIPELPERWTQGRPFLLTEVLLICLLIAWSRPGGARPSPLKLAATFGAFVISVWMHGAWYLWILLPGAFCLAQKWRDAMWLTICWLAGALAGALLTGHPFGFLGEQIQMARAIRAEHVPAWLLVGEFRPHQGEFASVALLAAVYIWTLARKGKSTGLAHDPAFWLLLGGWALGFVADRFWADWGLPAGLAWMALQFEDALTSFWPAYATPRLLACGAIALPLLWDTTNDLHERYTASLHDVFLDASAPALRSWIPGPGGIFYSAQMRFFYNTFYKNPRGDWKYILGFEPALMPEEDLQILRRIQLSNSAPIAYELWARKLRPIDRLEIESPTQPNLPELEWKRATDDIWLGRLPVTPSRAEPKQKG